MEAGRYGGCGQIQRTETQTALLLEEEKQGFPGCLPLVGQQSFRSGSKKRDFRLTGAALSWKPPVANIAGRSGAELARARLLFGAAQRTLAGEHRSGSSQTRRVAWREYQLNSRW
jgi:hypothetical protein